MSGDDVIYSPGDDEDVLEDILSSGSANFSGERGSATVGPSNSRPITTINSSNSSNRRSDYFEPKNSNSEGHFDFPDRSYHASGKKYNDYRYAEKEFSQRPRHEHGSSRNIIDRSEFSDGYRESHAPYKFSSQNSNRHHSGISIIWISLNHFFIFYLEQLFIQLLIFFKVIVRAIFIFVI